MNVKRHEFTKAKDKRNGLVRKIRQLSTEYTNFPRFLNNGFAMKKKPMGLREILQYTMGHDRVRQ